MKIHLIIIKKISNCLEKTAGMKVFANFRRDESRKVRKIINLHVILETPLKVIVVTREALFGIT